MPTKKRNRNSLESLESVYVRFILEIGRSTLNNEKAFVHKIYETQFPLEGLILPEYLPMLVGDIKTALENYKLHVERLTEEYQILFRDILATAEKKTPKTKK